MIRCTWCKNVAISCRIMKCMARVLVPVSKIEGLDSQLDHVHVRKGLLAYCARVQLYSKGKDKGSIVQL